MDREDKNTLALITLALCEELGNRKKTQLLEAVQSPSDLFLSKHRAATERMLGQKHSAEFSEKQEEAEAHVEFLKKKGVHWLSAQDEEYPQRLREIDDAPVLLFAKGDLSLLNRDGIAVVGTRRPTRYGAKVAESFSRDFANAGLVIISGFARGIDAIAHKSAIEAKAPTIAVLACGLDVCYPAENRGLYDAIIQGGGLLMSEYAIGTKPLQYHFPERNRLISGLSKAVFLPEAAKASGSLITARLAVEQGRDLFVVPGNIFSEESAGCNQLLREVPSACTLSSEDILDSLRVKRKSKEENIVELNMREVQIAQYLHDEEKHFEEILEHTGLKVDELIDTLIDMELKGVLEQTGGNYYSLC
jgi:DNA processing protein